MLKCRAAGGQGLGRLQGALYLCPMIRTVLCAALIAGMLPFTALGDNHRQTVFAFSPRHYDLQLHWKHGEDQFWTLKAVRRHLVAEGRCPVFLSNGGIYGKDYGPLGLHIEKGKRIQKISPAKGRGNFSWNSGIFGLLMSLQQPLL